MTDNNNKNQDLSLSNDIPKCVLNDKNIPYEAKVYFGFLADLAEATGFVTYTNVQLAEMKGVSRASIDSWNQKLEKGKYLRKVVWKEHKEDPKTGKIRIHITRKIFIFLDE